MESKAYGLFSFMEFIFNLYVFNAYYQNIIKRFYPKRLSSTNSFQEPFFDYDIALVLMLSSSTLGHGGVCRPHGCTCNDTTISCDGLSLHALPPHDFPVNTRKLYLQNNNIIALPSTALTSLTNLEILNISHNTISSISNTSFRVIEDVTIQLAKLQSFSFLYAQAHDIKNYLLYFSDLKNLTKLILNDNKLTTLDGYLRTSLSQLRVLILRSNRISSVTQNALDNLKKLEYLDLAENSISFIHQDAFTKLSDLKMLHLENNSLVTASRKWFTSFHHLANISLTNNAWACDCKMKEYYDWFRGINKTSPFFRVKHSLNVFCKLNGQRKRLKTFASHDFICTGAKIASSQTSTAKVPIGPTIAPTPLQNKDVKTSDHPFHPPTQKAKAVSISTSTRKHKSHTTTTKKEEPVSNDAPGNEDAKLECSLPDSAHLIWEKDGSRFKASHSKNKFVMKNNKLTIKAAQKTDEGEYCCKNGKSDETTKKCYTFTVNEKDDLKKTKPSNTESSQAHSAVVAVAVLLVLSVIIGIGVYCYKRVIRIRRERYGLLNDSRTFEPVVDSVADQYQSSNQGASEEYV